MEVKKTHKWGVDLGGTKIEMVVLDQHNEIVIRERIDTEAQYGYYHIISQINKLYQSVKTKIGFEAKTIGFATPGVLDPSTQTMKNCNTVCMNGQAMKKDIEVTLKINAILANDANCFALAETHMGVVKKSFSHAKVVFGVIMGTGVGGGLVVNGQAIVGRHGIGGEWGHNILEENGTPCYCGKAGCVEKVISGPALELFYEKIAGKKLSLKQIYSNYKEGIDHAAELTMERLFEYFGKGISTLINVIDPDVIVIGGGVGNIDELYSIGYEKISKYIFNNKLVETPIIKPALGDSAGVFGAAFLS